MTKPAISILVSAVVLLSLPFSEGCKKTREIATQASGSLGISEPTYADAIRRQTDPGRMDALRWPNFADVQKPVSTFYENRGYTLAWSRNGQPTTQAASLIEAFSHASERGLNPEDYDASRWQQRTSNLSSDSAKVLFDLAISINACRFVNAIHMGRVDPQHFAFGVKVDGKQLDLPNVLESQLSNSSNVEDLLASMEPQSAQYTALKRVLKQYLDLASQDNIDPLPAVTKSVALTGSYPSLDLLAKKLVLLGDLPAPMGQGDSDAPHGPVAISTALRHFQRRHGLVEDGRLSPATVDALNTPIQQRIAQIDDTLERWRWLSEEYLHPTLLVNLPEFVLRAFDGESEAFSMRVVDGDGKKDEHHTPILADHLRYLVFRPYWNVPVSIAKKEIVPHIQRDPGYLASHNYETVTGKGEVVVSSVERIEHGGLMVREKPGPTNSLGLVKFMFPNQFNVYLHDTNSHSLFDRNRRDFSHGCVRVQEPQKLAEWLLRDDGRWDSETIQQTMKDESVQNKTVSLKKSVPIVLFYGTAYVEDDEVHFFKDLYGYDKDLEETLKKGPPYPKKPIRQQGEASV